MLSIFVYKKVDTNLNFVQREKKWKSSGTITISLKKSIDSRKKGESYVFYDGPPTANGKPHIGHVLTRANQGYDTKIPRNEGLSRASERLAGTHTACQLSLR